MTDGTGQQEGGGMGVVGKAVMPDVSFTFKVMAGTLIFVSILLIFALPMDFMTGIGRAQLDWHQRTPDHAEGRRRRNEEHQGVRSSSHEHGSYFVLNL